MMHELQGMALLISSGLVEKDGKTLTEKGRQLMERRREERGETA